MRPRDMSQVCPFPWVAVSHSPDAVLIFLSLALDAAIMVYKCFFLETFAGLFFRKGVKRPVAEAAVVSSIRGPLLADA